MGSVRRILSLDTPSEVAPQQSSAEAEPIRMLAPEQSIPPNELFGMNLKELEGFRELRVNLKLEKELELFVNGFEDVLKYFNPHDKHFDHKIVKFVCQNAEYYFTRKKSGKLKEKAVCEVCKRYFNNDVELVKVIISLVLPLVKKCSVYRRYKKRISGFIGFFLNIASQSYKPQY